MAEGSACSALQTEAPSQLGPSLWDLETCGGLSLSSVLCFPCSQTFTWVISIRCAKNWEIISGEICLVLFSECLPPSEGVLLRALDAGLLCRLRGGESGRFWSVLLTVSSKVPPPTRPGLFGGSSLNVFLNVGGWGCLLTCRGGACRAPRNSEDLVACPLGLSWRETGSLSAGKQQVYILGFPLKPAGGERASPGLARRTGCSGGRAGRSASAVRDASLAAGPLLHSPQGTPLRGGRPSGGPEQTAIRGLGAWTHLCRPLLPPRPAQVPGPRLQACPHRGLGGGVTRPGATCLSCLLCPGRSRLSSCPLASGGGFRHGISV